MAGAPKRRRSNGCPPYQHVWPLGALAELICEASSSNSHSVWIDAYTSVDAEPYLSIRDAGPGLSTAELRHRLKVTTPLTTWHRNGAYASPWQAAAMRLGADVVVLSKDSQGASYAALLSRTRLAESGPAALNEPTIVLDWATVSPSSPELTEFLVYTPWSSYDAVLDAFATIEDTGTVVIIHSLKRNPEDGELELDLHSDRLDILCLNPNDLSEPPARISRSLRAYLELLFLRPTFRMILRSTSVRPRRLRSMLWGPADFCYTPRARTDLGLIGRDPGRATIRLGFDPKANTSEFGMLLYCRGRLIRPYLKVGLQAHVSSGVRVVGIVEAEFVTPTPNMQSFERDKYYQGLMFSLDRSLKIFWSRYGSMAKVLEAHAHDSVPNWAICDDCRQWRIVSKQCPTNPADAAGCSRWVCAMNVGGTVTCGDADDEDIQVITIRKRMPASNRLGSEFSTPVKRMRTETKEESFDKEDIMHLESKHVTGFEREGANDALLLHGTNAPSSDLFRNVRQQSKPDTPDIPRFDEAERNAVQALTANTTFTSVQSPSRNETLGPHIDLDGPMPDLFPSGLLELGTDDFDMGKRSGLSMVKEKDGNRMTPPNIANERAVRTMEAPSPQLKQSRNVSDEITVDGSLVPLQMEVAKCSTNASPNDLYPADESLLGSSELGQRTSDGNTDHRRGSEKVLTRSSGAPNFDPLKSSSSISHEASNGNQRLEEGPPLRPSSSAVNAPESASNAAPIAAQDDVDSWRKRSKATPAQPLSANVHAPPVSRSPKNNVRMAVQKSAAAATAADEICTTQALPMPSSVNTPHANEALKEKQRSSGRDLGYQKQSTTRPCQNSSAQLNNCTDFAVTDLVPFVKEGFCEDTPNIEGSGAKTKPSLHAHLSNVSRDLQGEQGNHHASPRHNSDKNVKSNGAQVRPEERPAATSKDRPLQQGRNGNSQSNEQRRSGGMAVGTDGQMDQGEVAGSKRQSQSSSVTRSPKMHPEGTQEAARDDGMKEMSSDPMEFYLKRGTETERQIPHISTNRTAAGYVPSSSEHVMRRKASHLNGSPPLRGSKIEGNGAFNVQHSYRQESTPKRRRSAIPEVHSDATVRKRVPDMEAQQNGFSSGGPDRERLLPAGDPLEGIEVPNDLFDFAQNGLEGRTPVRQLKDLQTREDMAIESGWHLQDTIQLDHPLPSPFRNLPDSVQPQPYRLSRSEFLELNNGLARNGQDPDGAQPSQTLAAASHAAASHAAASTAKAVLAGVGKVGEGHGSEPTNASNRMNLSDIALSAAVAAAAAAITATRADGRGCRGLSESGRPSDDRHSATHSVDPMARTCMPSPQNPPKEEVFKTKLQELVCLLAPGAGGGMASWLHNIESLDIRSLAREIEDRQEQKQREKVEQDLHQQMETLRASQQIACESLQNIRRLMRAFLDEVVGIGQEEEQDEPIESQFEEYLRVFDALPQRR